MTIEVRQVDCGRTRLVEYSRPGVATVYLLGPSVADEVDKVRNPDARWRLITQVAILKRKKRPEER